MDTSTTASGTTAAGSAQSSGSGSAMKVGINEAGWGMAGATDVAGSFKIDRFDTSNGEPVSEFTSHDVEVIVTIVGPYNTGGVSALDASSWAATALSYFDAQCAGSSTKCPAVEVLNEPGGSWFWGPNASSAANASAYAKLLKTTHTAFAGKYGASAPVILASYDGGSAGSTAWGEAVWAADPSVGSYVDGVTVHPYGGTGNMAQSAVGNRASVTAAHMKSGKPVWITEVGWPTAVSKPSTGDSLQWTELAQAQNVYGFVTWASSTGYVSAVTIFGYRDYGTNDWYGVERYGQGGSTVDGSKKPAWTALTEAAAGQPCSVCQ